MQKTIDDITVKAQGDYEIICILDGYRPILKEHPNLVVIHHKESQGMRASVNSAARIANGEFLLKSDAHCMFAEGFDEILKEDCEEDWVVIPRRYSLDAEKWAISENGRMVDYEYFIYPRKFNPIALHGFRWDERTGQQKDVLLDDTLTFQGSCWMMKKKHFERHGFLTIEGYHGLPQQEAEEIGLTTWMSGGRVAVNKKTWYAHFHKSGNRGYFMSLQQARECYAFSYQHWVHEHKEGFIRLINQFWPLPNWPKDWEKKLY